MQNVRNVNILPTEVMKANWRDVLQRKPKITAPNEGNRSDGDKRTFGKPFRISFMYTGCACYMMLYKTVYMYIYMRYENLATATKYT